MKVWTREHTHWIKVTKTKEHTRCPSSFDYRMDYYYFIVDVPIFQKTSATLTPSINSYSSRVRFFFMLRQFSQRARSKDSIQRNIHQGLDTLFIAKEKDWTIEKMLLFKLSSFFSTTMLLEKKDHSKILIHLKWLAKNAITFLALCHCRNGKSILYDSNNWINANEPIQLLIWRKKVFFF